MIHFAVRAYDFVHVEQTTVLEVGFMALADWNMAPVVYCGVVTTAIGTFGVIFAKSGVMLKAHRVFALSVEVDRDHHSDSYMS